MNENEKQSNQTDTPVEESQSSSSNQISDNEKLQPSLPKDVNLKAIFNLMDERSKEAIKIIKKSPYLKTIKNNYSSHPWFLVLSDEESKFIDYLEDYNQRSPIPPLFNPVDRNEINWTWWFLNKCVMVNLLSDKIGNPQKTNDYEIWQKCLYLLQRARPKFPLNGVVIALDAEFLLSDPTSIRQKAIILRSQLDELQKSYHILFPVYLVFTGLENISGFQGFMQNLPEAYKKQVFGYRLENTSGKGTLYNIDSIFDNIEENLFSSRSAQIKTFENRANAMDIFQFPERILSFKPGLKLMSECLFGENPYQYQPFWRGLYFMGKDTEPLFSEDLFDHFLPVDGPLARKR